MSAAARAPVPAAPEPWLAVIGIGDDGLASLCPAARALLEAGEVVVGGARHLALVPDHQGERLAWRSPLEATLEDLEARRGRRVVVLASGDPMCFGVGELLARHFAPEEMQVVPAPSSISLVCARLGWSRPAVEAISLHARPQSALLRHLVPGARLIVLSHDGETPNRVAALLDARGFGPSRLWTFEHLGGAGERRREATAATWRPTILRGAQCDRDRLRGRPRGDHPRDRARAAGRCLPLRWHADQARGAGGDAGPADAASRPVLVGRRRRQRGGRDRVAARRARAAAPSPSSALPRAAR